MGSKCLPEMNMVLFFYAAVHGFRKINESNDIFPTKEHSRRSYGAKDLSYVCLRGMVYCLSSLSVKTKAGVIANATLSPRLFPDLAGPVEESN